VSGAELRREVWGSEHSTQLQVKNNSMRPNAETAGGLLGWSPPTEYILVTGAPVGLGGRVTTQKWPKIGFTRSFQNTFYSIINTKHS